MTGQYFRPIVAVAALISGFAVATPAMAAPNWNAEQMKISYSGIDLTSAAGRQLLNSRVDGAIRRLCGAPVTGDFQEADQIAACRSEARAAVEPGMNAAIARAGQTSAMMR